MAGGYVRERPNGKWLARVRNAEGKQYAKTFGTEKEARDWVTAEEIQKDFARDDYPDLFGDVGRGFTIDAEGMDVWDRGDQEGPGRTVATYARQMIDQQNLKPTTKHAYNQSLRLYIEKTELGRTPIGSLTPDDINRWWRGVKDSGRNNALQVLSKVLKRAVRSGELPSNPLDRCEDVKRIRKRKGPEVEPLTVPEVEALADAAGAERRGVSEYVRDRDRMLVRVMGFAGLRAGEAAALRPSDLLPNCRLRVHRGINKVTGQPAYADDPKTHAGKRTPTIACSLWEDLKAFTDRWEIPATKEMFHGKDGVLMHHKTVNHVVSGAGTRIGLDVNSHQLRHSAVSILINESKGRITAPMIQKFVGHSRIEETLGTYGHLFDQSGQGVADVMEGLLEDHRNGG
jgi:integrase